MVVAFEVGTGAGHADSTTIHLVTDRSEGRMPADFSTNVRQVVCDCRLGEARKTLDLLLMSATLAALNATTKVPSKS